VKAVGTSFNVKDSGELMLVAVLEGAVEVLDRNPMANGEPLGTLQRGEIAQVTQRGDKPRVQVSRAADIDRFGVLTAGWRDGWLSYEDTTLARIVDDLNRYYDRGVRLADPSVGALHVTASFRVEKIGQFLDSIPSVLPVLVEKRADGSYLLRSAQEPSGER
jgi:transmembrane sensor